MEGSRRIGFVAIVVVALGVTLSTTLKDYAPTLGVILVAVGGFLLVVALSRRRNEQQNEE